MFHKATFCSGGSPWTSTGQRGDVPLAMAQHPFALAEGTLGFCISSPALAAAGMPSCLGGHGGDGSVCWPCRL